MMMRAGRRGRPPKPVLAAVCSLLLFAAPLLADDSEAGPPAPSSAVAQPRANLQFSGSWGRHAKGGAIVGGVEGAIAGAGIGLYINSAGDCGTFPCEHPSPTRAIIVGAACGALIGGLYGWLFGVPLPSQGSRLRGRSRLSLAAAPLNDGGFIAGASVSF